MAVRLLVIFFLLLHGVYAEANGQESERGIAFPIPSSYRLVNDYIGILPLTKVVQITQKLQALEKRNGTQIVFLAVPSVGDEGTFAYGLRVAEQWDIGNNGQGNGVLYLASPEGSYILTGPGIAGALPDVKIRRIFSEAIDPLMQQERFDEAIEAGIDAMIQAAWGEETKPTFYDYYAVPRGITVKQILLALVIVAALVYGLLAWWRNRRKVRA